MGVVTARTGMHQTRPLDLEWLQSTAQLAPGGSQHFCRPWALKRTNCAPVPGNYSVPAIFATVCNRGIIMLATLWHGLMGQKCEVCARSKLLQLRSAATIAFLTGRVCLLLHRKRKHSAPSSGSPRHESLSLAWLVASPLGGRSNLTRGFVAGTFMTNQETCASCWKRTQKRQRRSKPLETGYFVGMCAVCSARTAG